MIYKANKFTINDYGKLKVKIENMVKKNPQKVLEDFVKEIDLYNKNL